MNDSSLFLKNLKKNLIKVGIKKKDSVYLGVNLGQAFKFYKSTIFQDRSLEKVREKCSKLIFHAISEQLGSDGTIICPTFTFDFIKKRVFDVHKTKSHLGYFENFFLKQKNVIRSEHPIFSIAVWGKNKKILKPCGTFSFGANSPFSNFIDYKVKFLNIGVKWVETCTYLHHLEHLNGINHRFYKPTKGKIINKDKSKIDIFYNPIRFVRLKSDKAEYRIEKHLKKKFLIKEAKDKIYCSSLKTKDVHDLGLKILQKKPSYFMSKDVNIYIDSKDKLTIKESKHKFI
ncbi:AAC(3) family N-acetyltransferase [Candidatus Pelagibacter sp.]|nr:AAC(3) family N-acetyltransferase [Candidatus Pelagibacter sp.]